MGRGGFKRIADLRVRFIKNLISLPVNFIIRIGMKRIFLYALYAVAALTASSCAKHVATGPNEAGKRYFDAWLHVNHPDAVPSGRGIYIIEESEGTGIAVTKDGYAFVEYTVTDLDGNISSYTSAQTAQMLGQYKEANYYGPKAWTTEDNTIMAGVADIVVGMKTGATRKAVVPSWLLTYSVYGTADEYLKNETENANAIYEIKVTDFTKDTQQWQIDSIGGYFNSHRDIFGTMTAADSLKQKGFYYKQVKAPVDTTSFPKDTTIYINYTGKLLSGLVFDTTDEKTAKDNGIWSSSKTYAPVKVSWGEKFSDIKMGNNTVINGFSNTLWQMRAMEKGIGIFWSDLGYGKSGSGNSIPAYSPLVFEIEIVEKPEE